MTFEIRGIGPGGRGVPAADGREIRRTAPPRGKGPGSVGRLPGPDGRTAVRLKRLGDRTAEHGRVEGVGCAVLGEVRLLSLDMADEPRLPERTDAGREARRLLIEQGRADGSERERRRLLGMVESLEARVARLERAVAGSGDDLGAVWGAETPVTCRI